MAFIGLHNHSDHSNYRLADAINTTESLLKYTHQLGHSGMAITDHETIGASLEIYEKLQELKKENPEEWKNYKLILGNEIYLCDRKKMQEDKDYTFPHFILLAKDAIGHQQLRELSTIAWTENSFTWVMMRVPTFYDNLFKVLKGNKGHLIGSSACMGGSLPQNILKAYNLNIENPDYSNCIRWIQKMKNCFGEENFFLELQPSTQKEQDIVNKVLIKLSKETNTPYIITTDSHYLQKKDQPIHEAFLKSQEGERELGDFYNTTYVMSEEEIHSYLDNTIGYEAVEEGFKNTIKIGEICEDYDLRKPLRIPYLPSNLEEPSKELFLKYKNFIPLLEYFYNSKYSSDRHMVREIVKKLEERPEEFCNKESYEALQICLESIKISSEKNKVQWSAYLLQTKDLIEVCWITNSLTAPSRGSGGGFFLLYVLDIIQINPLREKVPLYHWRFLNPERVSTLDIDTDIEGNKRDLIIQNLKEKYGGDRHVSKVQTLLREKAKAAIQAAARGVGIDNDIAIFLSSFIKSERGMQFDLKQTFYGDESNNLKPDKEFVRLMTEEYPNLWEVAQRIEGLIVGCGQHAGGVIIDDEDIINSAALMRTNNGEVITQYDLHRLEDVSLIKWDLLATDAQQKIHICLDLLLKDKLIEWQGNLRDTYEKYLGIYNIDRTSQKMWDMIRNHKIFSFFQMEQQSGYQAIELGQPKSVEDLSVLNSVMRLMAPEEGAETPLERYARFKKDINLWYQEMDDYGLTKEEQEVVKKYAEKNYGLLPNQEDFMSIVQETAIGGMSLLWADKLRKSIARLLAH